MMMRMNTSTRAAGRMSTRSVVSPMVVQRRVVVKNRADDGASKIEEGGKDLLRSGQKNIDKAGDKAEKTGNKLNDIGADVKDAIGRKAEQAGHALENATDAVYHSGSHTGDKIKDVLEGAAHDTKKEAGKAERELRS